MLNREDVRWEKIDKCNLCGKRKFKVFLRNVRYFENDIDFTLVQCTNCELVFLNPRPIKKDIAKFYKSESYWGQDLNSSKTNNKTEKNKNYGPIYNLINVDKKKSILDIGAGTGLFLTKFKEKKWDIFGIEFSKDAVRYANQKHNLNLKSGDFLDFDFGVKKFDYIVMNNVLEHLYNPSLTVKKTNKTLSDDGRLIIAVPNIDSLGFKIFKKNWYPLQPPIHLFQFTPTTIKIMLDKAGYKNIKIIHSYPVHSIFSLFESYRSLLTGRNKRVINADNNDSEKIIKKKNPLKELLVVSGKIFAYIITLVGSLLKRGENIIIYAEKN